MGGEPGAYPLLTTEKTHVIGPGGEDAVTGPDGRSWIAFHGWDSAQTERDLYLLPLTWQGDRPDVTP